MRRTKHISINSVFKTAVRLNGDFNVQYMRFSPQTVLIFALQLKVRDLNQGYHC